MPSPRDLEELLRPTVTTQRPARSTAERLGLTPVDAAKLRQDADRSADGWRDQLRQWPQDSQALYFLSCSELDRNHLPAAEKAILEALAVEPRRARLLSQYAQVLVSARQLDKAGRLLDQVAAAEAGAMHVLDVRWSLAVERGDDSRARELAAAMSACSPAAIELDRQEWEEWDRERAAARASTVANPPTDEDTAGRPRAARDLHPMFWPTLLIDRVNPRLHVLVLGAICWGLIELGLDPVGLVIVGVWLLAVFIGLIGKVVLAVRAR